MTARRSDHRKLSEISEPIVLKERAQLFRKKLSDTIKSRFDSFWSASQNLADLNNLIYILDLKTVSSRRLSVHTEVQEITPGGSLSESASCVWKIGEGLFDLNCNVFDSLEIRPEDLDTQH